MKRTQSKRSYLSPLRTQAAAQKRAQVLRAAAAVLRSERGALGFSLEAVAKAAGVSRLTVYNQFGSRRALLEAVLEHLSEQGGIARIQELAFAPDPLKALDQLVELFCLFWHGEAALTHLYDAIAIDPEMADALGGRIEFGMRVIRALVIRLLPKISARRRQEVVEAIHLLINVPSYRALARQRSLREVIRMLRVLCRGALLLGQR